MDASETRHEELLPSWLAKAVVFAVAVAMYGVLSFSGNVPTVFELITPAETPAVNPAGVDGPAVDTVGESWGEPLDIHSGVVAPDMPNHMPTVPAGM